MNYLSLLAFFAFFLLLPGCGKDEEGGPTMVCPERSEIIGRWAVVSVTDFEYFDNRTPPEAPVAEFTVEFFDDGTGVQQFDDSRPDFDLEFFLPRDDCETRLTTISNTSRLVNDYEQLEATPDRRVWQTKIDLFVAGSTSSDDLIGRQTITWTMERR